MAQRYHWRYDSIWMSITRRQLLQGAALAASSAALGCRARAITRRRVAQSIAGLPSVDGAGVRLLRILGQPALRHLDPFVLLDRIHSSDPADYIAGFPDHPHRGFETVTVMLDGHMLHRDSRGNHGDIVGGGAQWMTAGRGIVHSEMPRQGQGLLSGFQLWVNLPAREKMRAPEYQDLQPSALAHAALSPSGSALSLIAGEADGLRGPVRERATQPLLAWVALEDDRPLTLELPAGHAAFLFVAAGVLAVETARVAAGTLAVLTPGNRLVVRAPVERSAALIAAGRPLHEPIVQRGPFVMNSDEEIRRAFDDYRNGTLG
jgi:redox-sensitive bicupin YhaK (pirin superfamily)